LPDALRSCESLRREEIEKAIADRLAARKSRNFAQGDQICQDLAAKGVVLEDTKEGTCWKYANEPRP